MNSPCGMAVDGFTVIVGQMTLRVKFCTASGGKPLVAVNTSGNVPICVAVPPRSLVPVLNVMPAGSPPVCETVGAGTPVVVTVKLSAVPTVNVSLVTLVIDGGALTATVKFCVAFGSTPLVAMSVTGKDPLCVGVPESSPPDDSVRPVGSVPAVTLTVGAGKPFMTTRNVAPGVFTTNDAVFELAIVGASFTVSVNDWAGLEPTVLVAVKLMA